MFDNGHAQNLSRNECLRLLSHARLGRLVVIADALPAVHPVLFRVDDTDDDAVVVRLSAESPWIPAIHNQVVAFHVDDIDIDTQTGWSVSGVGQATLITDVADLARVSSLYPTTAAPPGASLIRIPLCLIHGQRIRSYPRDLAPEASSTGPFRDCKEFRG
ncbi:pyridoxamine 5'-phosphate oxidase family protein [Actinopolymorpha sp. B11F2]|uniref:pyridoxamine 5'-phosphate oxidase family protein n=1 Tax=Actinopolymorpha sp. B11F2 TaxID=3160862 RepID=UPI0032E506A3